MPWPVHPVGFFGSGDQDTYKVERSLRFNSADSAYLSRTPASAGNRKTWTWSGWVKRGVISSSNNYNYTLLNTHTGNNDNSYFTVYFYNDNIRITGWNTSWRITTQLFRDTSSWYHLVIAVDTTQATANNRIRLYVNGIEVTTFSTTNNPSQNADLGINQSALTYIGADVYAGPTQYFDGYLSEIHFIDGQALTPSSFGETDPITGRWKAKRYAGTYGTNGFYLNFADNSGTTSTTLGKDLSGNGNNWTPNNFSVTAGEGNDSLLDSPTDSGASGNYCTWNPIRNTLSGHGTFSNGNLQVNGTSGSINCIAGGTMILAGKMYWEIAITTMATPSTGGVGIMPAASNEISPVGSTITGIYYLANGNKRVTGTSSAYGSSYTGGDVIGIAVDVNAETITFYKNNVSQGSISGTGIISAGVIPFIGMDDVNSPSITANFGQRPFAYTAPTGFKALCTTNLPAPTIRKPSRYMDVKTYTGTGASNSITGLDFSPDLVWIKNRGTTTSHAIYDTTRGTQAQLSSNTTGDEVTSSTGLTAFGSNGFTVGTSSLVNTSGTQYVAWAWDEAPIAGFDIVSYTGNGANRTVSHNLGVSPKMLIVKARTTASTDQGWPVWHTSIANTTYLTLSTTSATATGADYWNSTSPTSSVFSLGTNVAVNANNDTYIAYLFAEVEGFSKFGSYTGNGSADGPFVWCGFQPRFILLKNASATSQWVIVDTARATINPTSVRLRANTTAAEVTETFFDILSNGFKVRATGTDKNDSGNLYTFAAFAESPFKYARAR